MHKRLATLLALACAAFAQPPAFEVASVKPSEPITPAMVNSGRVQIGVTIDALNVRISKFSLYDLLCLAFQVKSIQISVPGWTITERYDIQAKLPDGGQRKQVPAMLQTLLAERFGMTYHRETRDVPVFALVVAKGGPKLRPSAKEDEPAPAAPPGQIRGGMSVTAGGGAVSNGPNGNSRITPGPGGNQHVEAAKMTMIGLADLIGRYCELSVVDMTDIKGTYDLEIDVSGEEVRNAARAKGVAIPPPQVSETPADPAGVSLAASLSKLGLKLESRKAPVEVIVIDHLEKVPTAN